ncbi:MAG: type II toxin-antitoxin system PemK/MazF family toxin [Gallionella sp.]|nr:type II toxin-antitoxin system PemK/MazF family toxin [Gallionella sp.]
MPPCVDRQQRCQQPRASTVTILPLTSNVAKVYPFEVLLPAAESGLPKDSKIQAQQIRTITKERITGNAVGCVQKTTLQLVDAAIRLHLGV